MASAERNEQVVSTMQKLRHIPSLRLLFQAFCVLLFRFSQSELLFRACCEHIAVTLLLYFFLRVFATCAAVIAHSLLRVLLSQASVKHAAVMLCYAVTLRLFSPSDLCMTVSQDCMPFRVSCDKKVE